VHEAEGERHARPMFADVLADSSGSKPHMNMMHGMLSSLESYKVMQVLSTDGCNFILQMPLSGTPSVE
jgi:hypothetical protein